MIFIGIDDTDTVGSPGTNQLARRIAAHLPSGFEFLMALRHQLFIDESIEHTNGNGSASLLVRDRPGANRDDLHALVEREVRAGCVNGSAPGLCIASRIPEAVKQFGRRCQQSRVVQDDARKLADRFRIHLQGIGGSENGIIGAMAAIGLLASGNDGRVMHMNGWDLPDDFAGLQPAERILQRGVKRIIETAKAQRVEQGLVDVGERLRPSYRDFEVVLFVERPKGEKTDARSEQRVAYRALKLD